MITNPSSGTNVYEIADGIYRINTPVPLPDGSAFSFNQYLIVDEAPMLFHTGQRKLFPLVSEAIRAVLPVERLKYLALSHFEADECGALNEFLAAAPNAVPICGQVAAMVAISTLWFRRVIAADLPTHRARPTRSRAGRADALASSQGVRTVWPGPASIR